MKCKPVIIMSSQSEGSIISDAEMPKRVRSSKWLNEFIQMGKGGAM